jgi:hypothetical protein
LTSPVDLYLDYFDDFDLAYDVHEDSFQPLPGAACKVDPDFGYSYEVKGHAAPTLPATVRSDVFSSAASSTPDPESFLSDTCPETPDGSVKEDPDYPDNGSYVCLWDNCGEEFESQKLFVDHLGPILRNSISAEKFSGKFLSFIQKLHTKII